MTRTLHLDAVPCVAHGMKCAYTNRRKIAPSSPQEGPLPQPSFQINGDGARCRLLKMDGQARDGAMLDHIVFVFGAPCALDEVDLQGAVSDVPGI